MLDSLTPNTTKPDVAVPDERQLVERAQRDPQAMTALYRLHCQSIYGYVLRRVGNSHDADDLTAEVFLSMVRGLPKYRWRGAPFRAWLYRLATNEVNRWAKRRKRMAIRPASDSHHEQPAQPLADSSHDADLIHSALLTLAPKFQSVLALFYLEELPIAEIALVLRCREGTVKSRLSRGREMMRKFIERHEVQDESRRRSS